MAAVLETIAAMDAIRDGVQRPPVVLAAGPDKAAPVGAGEGA